MKEPPRYNIDDLLLLMARLRDPESGCPWDLQQDFQSIAKYTLEECFELIDALETDDLPAVRGELGDLLFQIVFYAQLAREQGLFDFAGVVNDITEKLLRRHPHVFADGDLHQPASGAIETPEVKQRWEAIKARERRDRGLSSTLDDVPNALPALSRAQKLQKRSANIGLDWHDSTAVLAALDEELMELRAALRGGDVDAVAHELGDVLFSTVNLARHLDCDAEQQLRAANRRFEARVRHVEASLRQHPDGADADDALLDELWQQAKQALARG